MVQTQQVPFLERVEEGPVESQRHGPKGRTATTGAEDSRGTEDKSQYHDQVDDVNVVTQRVQTLQNLEGCTGAEAGADDPEVAQMNPQ